MSESSKYLHLVTPFCQGNGVDIGSQGCPVVPWAIQMDLGLEKFLTYSGLPKDTPRTIQWMADDAAINLPFKDGVLDFVFSSHLLEDFTRDQWRNMIPEWIRTLKLGGHLVILVPEFNRWSQAVKNGQPPNLNHVSPEPVVGELTEHVKNMPVVVLEDRLTDLCPEDYSILFVAQKIG